MPPASNQPLLLDENVSKRLAKALQAGGYSVILAVDAHLGAQPDSDIFRYARSHQRTILTWDKDYLNREKFPLPHAGILIIRLPRRTSIPDVVSTVLQALTDLAGIDLTNKVYEITLDGAHQLF